MRSNQTSHSPFCAYLRMHRWHWNTISMSKCKKDVTPLLTHWSYDFLALTHRYMFSSTVTIYSCCYNLKSTIVRRSKKHLDDVIGGSRFYWYREYIDRSKSVLKTREYVPYKWIGIVAKKWNTYIDSMNLFSKIKKMECAYLTKSAFHANMKTNIPIIRWNVFNMNLPYS